VKGTASWSTAHSTGCEVAAEHAIAKSIGSFSLKDETYNRLNISPDAKVIYKTANPSSDGPLVWIGPCKTARVVVIQPGHFAETFDNLSYQELVRRSIAWAAGR